jgi:hypothetical protein
MDNFEQYLMQKYPDLFYKNESGELECPCGAWVPQGWEKTVDDLCGAIVQYTKRTYRYSDGEITNNAYYFWKACASFINWCYKMFPKSNKWQYNKHVFSFIEKFRQRYYKCVKYNRVYPPDVKIDQIKEKFGELRFYYSGGDDQVSGMVRFAEYLCTKTCEVSGEKGGICIRGNWYKTLSEYTRNTEPYKGYSPV